MKNALSVTPAADADIDAAANYIARDNLPAALRFYDAVERTFKEIAQYPRRSPRYELQHPLLQELRKRAIFDFPNYLAFFTIDQSNVLVIRVLHGARDLPAILHDELG